MSPNGLRKRLEQFPVDERFNDPRAGIPLTIQDGPGPADEALEKAIARARDAIIAAQDTSGYWCYELEADCTIPAEYIFFMHYVDQVDRPLQQRIAAYLRNCQSAGGGWPLYEGGTFDLSCSVKCYYALKLAGDGAEDPHMRAARSAILGHGGAAKANVFTRILLALFEQVPWWGVPFVPVEIMLLPRWFPFHLSKVSYWSRTVVVPLAVLCSLKPKARNPSGTGISELFVVPPDQERNYFPVRSRLNRLFLAVDAAGRWLEPLIPKSLRWRAIRRAENWFGERLNAPGGLGAIFPAIVNSYEAMDCLDYPPTHPARLAAKQALHDLLAERGETTYCQPCVPPVWDTALAAMALQEVDDDVSREASNRALRWVKQRQLLTEAGDWQDRRPELRGGGWPFQFQNSHYPDVDDSCAVAWAMHRAHEPDFDDAIQRATEWVCGMQSRDGGFGAFDVDNCHYYLNEIPFADHGALLDPSTSDVTARCVTLLGRLIATGHAQPQWQAVLERAVAFLRAEQEADGCWFGRWGTNYVYGTWSVLTAFQAAGIESDDPAVRAGVGWLKRIQRADGGWGESNDSYADPTLRGRHTHSTAFQTAWAVLGLLAGGEAASDEVGAGVKYLLSTQRADGLWHDDDFTAPGFPRVFYLKYHGYDKYFPLWALARYRRAGKPA